MSSSGGEGISVGSLFLAIVIMAIVLMLAIVKIYISNEIYYKSREVNRIEAKVEALRAENSILKMNVEKLKYKSQITDTIFPLDIERELKE